MTKTKKKLRRPLNRFERMKLKLPPKSVRLNRPTLASLENFSQSLQISAPIQQTQQTSCPSTQAMAREPLATASKTLDASFNSNGSFDELRSYGSNASLHSFRSTDNDNDSSPDFEEPHNQQNETLIEECDGYQLIDMALLSEAISGLCKCPVCAGDLKLCRERSSRIGLFEKLCFACPDCMKFKKTFLSSSIVAHPTKLYQAPKTEEVNTRLVQICFLIAVDRGQCPLNTERLCNYN